MYRSRGGIALVAAVGLLLAAVAPALGGLAATERDAAPGALQPDPVAPPEPAPTAARTGAGPGELAANQSPERVGLGSGERVSESGAPGAQLGAAVSVGDGALRVRFDRYRARQSLAEAENESARRAVVRATLNETSAAAERLRGREAAAIEAYHAGEIDRAELLRRLARIQVAAGEYRRTLEGVRTRADDVLTTGLRNEIISVRMRLSAFRGPVHERIVAGLTGRDVGAVRVTTTGSGLAVETFVRGQYVRDVVRTDRYRGGEGEPLADSPGKISERLLAVYPYAFSTPPLGTEFFPAGDRLFRVEFAHPQGRIRAFLNRETGAVYREIQWLQLDQAYTETVINRTTEGVRVTVSRVGGSDPTRVRLVDADTGVPVDATVVRGNETLGATEDGELWVLLGPTPAELTLRTDRGPINVTVGAPATDGNASLTAGTGGVDAGASGAGADVDVGVGIETDGALRERPPSIDPAR